LVKKVSLSLPDRLFEELDGLAKESGRTRSSIVVEALKAYLGEPDSRLEAKTYPTALQKLREQGVIKLRSPRLAKARVESDWIVESEV
jgi:metal-responsive CopG/Arc/MetJ family transcriptional regulator